MKSLVFLKAHKLNNGIVEEYLKIKKTNTNVIVVFDNKDKKINNAKERVTTINYNGVSFTALLLDVELYIEHQLPIYYDNVHTMKDANRFMWYNSDYPLYLVQKFFPDYDFYWQIEYDVYCNGESYDEFFNLYENNCSDLLICRFTKADSAWWATKHVDWVWTEDVTLGCSILPLCRVSSRCIQFLYQRRIEHGKLYKQFEDNSEQIWPYCELFIATETLNNKTFTAEPILNQFITDVPIMNLFRDRIFLKKDNKLYHPVR